MTQEEKAKRYDEAIERARQFSEKPYLDDSAGIVEYIFPELAESEDERIRKELIEYIKDQQYSFISAPDCRDKYEEEENDRYNSWIAWLEKQGEIIKEWSEMKFNNIQTELQGMVDLKQKTEQGEQKPVENSCKKSDDITTEEKDMTEYKKGFECGKQRVLKYQEDFDLCKKTLTAWSEEDEKIIRRIDSLLYSQCKIHGSEYEEIHNWLKSLTPQPKQEWSEEDERNLNDVILFIKTGTYSLDKEKLIDWVKSFRPQNTWKPSDEQMDALNDVISSRDIKYDVLSELWEQLKKLREE